MALHNILSKADLPEGRARRVKVADRVIAVFNVNGTLYAIDDTCTHEGGPLNEGDVNDCAVTCPWHGAEFDLRTGEALTPPAVENVSTYRVVVSGNDIFLEID
jgi:nitrite reductase/ring-hydroxylating ferredoxin subunit